MYPKDFIKHVLINEYKDIVDRHAYLSFTLIAIGIEFLGKCMLSQHKDWNRISPDKAFNEGLKLLVAVDKKYGQLSLKNELRNGLAHTLMPKSKIVFSETKNGAIHFGLNSLNQTVLVAEIFYRDFVIACNMVLARQFPQTDKMNKLFMRVGK